MLGQVCGRSSLRRNDGSRWAGILARRRPGGVVSSGGRPHPPTPRPPMQTAALLLAFTAALAVSAQEKKDTAKTAPVIPPKQGTTETIKLFDGKSLDGWEGYSDLWSVKDGEIVARNDKPLKYSTYLLTKDKYTDFRLTFAAKLVESEMHSGVAFWG